LITHGNDLLPFGVGQLICRPAVLGGLIPAVFAGRIPAPALKASFRDADYLTGLLLTGSAYTGLIYQGDSSLAIR
jgi:hypothetical protein